MKKTSSYKLDMTTGALLPKMLRFALPLMASSLLQLLFNAADVAVVGKFAGDNSLAAVGSTSSLINLSVPVTRNAPERSYIPRLPSAYSAD